MILGFLDSPRAIASPCYSKPMLQQACLCVRIANLHPQQQQHADSDDGGDDGDDGDDDDGVWGGSIMSNEDLD